MYNLLYLGCAFTFMFATLLAVRHHHPKIVSHICAARKYPKLHDREEVAFYLNIVVFLVSIYCHTVEATNLDDVYIPSRGIKINAAMYLDWTITCPILQLIFWILAGSKTTVSAGYHLTVTAVMILSGAVGCFFNDGDRRFFAFSVGSLCMVLMTRNMDLMITQSTENTSNLFCGRGERPQAERSCQLIPPLGHTF